ncbi:S-methyl-5'-thioadenosine phosphorylase isoform X2 [Phoca vitulina]|uniref:S-methyl-5'-thioadenosine phosphorylase isoform X2 n=1 Tax=Phoca vitulina TaxID=9720 RepID=UPI0013960078|nr:S-methyl-5'-thioadenosine phosphorylase isoform X2 [Phoca vitulina]
MSIASSSQVFRVVARVKSSASDSDVSVRQRIDTAHLPYQLLIEKYIPCKGGLHFKTQWHGRQHTIMPSKVNYQANIWALKEEGCTHVVVTTACGSLREEIQPGDIVIIDQFIDRTTKRPQTFYDGSHSSTRGVCHIPVAEPFCPKTREVLIETAKKLGLRCHSKGTVVTIEGPRFSSRAESFMFRTWGADVINMTTVPEVVLAKEAGICYASIAMATDYDCWKEHEEAVSVDRVLKTLKENANKAKSLLLTTIPQIGSMEWSETLHNLKNMAQFSVLLPRH